MYTCIYIWQLPVCLVDCRRVQAFHREAPVPLVLGLPQGVEKNQNRRTKA